jgi:sugar phosphate isomerase/epimerase
MKASALVSAGALVRFPAFAYNNKLIGLQLYTVRDAMAADPAGTLAKVAKLGYNSVEGATYTGTQKFYGLSPKEFAALLKQNGLIMKSAHYRLGEEKNQGADVQGTILHNWQKAVDDAAEAGVHYMVCAYLSEPERGNAAKYTALAATLNKSAETVKKAGLQLCYHNHDFEFKKVDGKLPFDIILAETDKELVKIELDLYWASKVNVDPVSLFNKHKGRFPLWHVKDMDKTPERAFTEVGNGTIDFKRIFAHATIAGLKYFFVEQDKTPGDPFESIAKSITYVKHNLI